MNKILNHQTNPSTRQSQKQTISQSQIYSNNNYAKNKHAIQQLYKNQLDTFLNEKQKLKKQQKQRLQKQKQEYRQNLRIGQQNQKIKNMAYKNYYMMLMQGQNLNSQTYISPYQKRNKQKQQLINSSIQQQQKKAQTWQYQMKKRQIQKKNQYKDQLMKQIEQRKRTQNSKRQSQQQQNFYIRQYNNLNQQIQQFDRQRKKQQMNHYKGQLDRFMEDKVSKSRRNTQTHGVIKYNDDYHNPLVNPLPYNIQNPYILRQLEKSRSIHIKTETPIDDYYMPSNNVAQDKYKQIDKSYFAQKGNNLLR